MCRDFRFFFFFSLSFPSPPCCGNLTFSKFPFRFLCVFLATSSFPYEASLFKLQNLLCSPFPKSPPPWCPCSVAFHFNVSAGRRLFLLIATWRPALVAIFQVVSSFSLAGVYFLFSFYPLRKVPERLCS